ncbi:MAG: hypothetical protein IPL10_02320 [Bacteroidetes bacterium]|nr:hypothetical protein [Bacteroidota bacterium]
MLHFIHSNNTTIKSVDVINKEIAIKNKTLSLNPHKKALFFSYPELEMPFCLFH